MIDGPRAVKQESQLEIPCRLKNKSVRRLSPPYPPKLIEAAGNGLQPTPQRVSSAYQIGLPRLTCRAGGALNRPHDEHWTAEKSKNLGVDANESAAVRQQLTG